MKSYTAFELFTQRVFQKIENNNTFKNSHVQHNVRLKGKSGCIHQIDVYWTYEDNGQRRNVAIECKNFKSKISIGKVRDFFGVINDLENVQGTMVSSQGFQKGAKRFAEFYGISLKGLRKPYWNESAGLIKSTFHIDKRRLLYRFDDDWVTKQKFNLERLRHFYASFLFAEKEYWLNADYFPIGVKDHFIRDSKGVVISSIEELEKQLPQKPRSGSVYLFPFEDGWLESLRWGPVKIREVKFSFVSTIQETIMNLAAEDFVEGILEDAIDGKIDYVPR